MTTSIPDNEEYTVETRIWIKGSKGTYLGEGRIALLEKIGETGSISAAARSLGMSYRKAWKLVESMNSQAPTPLVIRQAGGASGGGTQLTEAGREASKVYKSLTSKLNDLLNREWNKNELKSLHHGKRN